MSITAAPTAPVQVDDVPIRSEVVAVTPQQAERWLEHNLDRQRSLSPARVKEYVAKMRDGRWHLTHQGIAFDRDGRLIDGQHRLRAVVEAAVAVPMVVTYGVDHFEVVDTGKPRSAGDILTIAGHGNSSHLAAALRLHILYTSRTERPWRRTGAGVTPADIKDTAAVHGEAMAESLFVGRRVAQRIGGSRAAITAGLYVCERWAGQNDLAATFEQWIDGFVTGIGLPEGDGRLALASWLRGAARPLINNIRAEVTMLLTIRAFHGHVTGESLRRFLVRDPSTYMYRLPASY